MKLKKLTPEEERIILRKGTEKPFTGKYVANFEDGLYACRRCDAPLYWSSSKFESDCGWPSFDDEIRGAVKKVPDPDGNRTEIQCAKCGGHLGHVFEGEHLTKKDIRHCVNSLSMKFIPKSKLKLETIVLGGGCFWCTEAVFKLVDGVIFTSPGYAGGTMANPTYNQVCSGNTGHAEVAEVILDPKKVKLEKILEIFFSMHDPTSVNKQGNDVGTQYRSIILYTREGQKKRIESFIRKIRGNYPAPIVTEVKKLDVFYKAEKEHKEYFEKNPFQPYCMLVIRPKVEKIKAML